MNFSIIIPVYNMWPLVHQRLMELRQRVPPNCAEIIIVDDCSPEDFKKPLGYWQNAFAREDLPIRYLRNETNLGFGSTCNQGALLARGDVLAFLSTDVMVSGDFITPAHQILTEKPTALIGGQLIDWPAGWNEIEIDGKKTVIPYLGGWLILCKRETWEDLGGFDPIYAPYDYEDVDLSTTAYFKGIPLVPLNLPFLKHMSGATISTLNVDRMKTTQQNREKYIQKWRSKLSE